MRKKVDEQLAATLGRGLLRAVRANPSQLRQKQLADEKFFQELGVFSYQNFVKEKIEQNLITGRWPLGLRLTDPSREGDVAQDAARYADQFFVRSNIATELKTVEKKEALEQFIYNNIPNNFREVKSFFQTVANSYNELRDQMKSYVSPSTRSVLADLKVEIGKLQPDEQDQVVLLLRNIVARGRMT